MRTRLRRLASRWQKREAPTVSAPDAAASGRVTRAQSTGQDETKHRLADAQARLKQAVPPKDA